MQVNQITAARILDCNVETIRALQKSNTVVPSPSGYTIEQLIFIRVLLHLRAIFKCRNFSFARGFDNYLTKLKFDDIVVDTESGLVVVSGYPEALINYWLPDLTQEIQINSDTNPIQLEVFNSVDDKTEKTEAGNTTYYFSKPKIHTIIPICRVRKHILKRMEQKELFTDPSAGGRPASWSKQISGSDFSSRTKEKALTHKI